MWWVGEFMVQKKIKVVMFRLLQKTIWAMAQQVVEGCSLEIHGSRFSGCLRVLIRGSWLSRRGGLWFGYGRVVVWVLEGRGHFWRILKLMVVFGVF